LTQKYVTTLYQPPYSSDLSPPDYFLFPKLKMKFADVAEIHKGGPKRGIFGSFQKPYDHAKVCIHATTAYFE
jgi:hypothetical protein